MELGKPILRMEIPADFKLNEHNSLRLNEFVMHVSALSVRS